MKKFILAVMVMLFGMTAASAQDYDQTYFTLTTTDGGSIKFMFDDEPVMTFDGSEVVITDYAGVSVRYQMENVVNLTFDKLTSVESVVSENTVNVVVTGNYLRISGLKANAGITLHSMAGTLVAAASADADGNAEIAVDTLPKGVYVAAMPGHSFKFIR